MYPLFFENLVTPYCFMRKLILINKFLLSTRPHVLQMSVVGLHCIQQWRHSAPTSICHLFLLYRNVIFQVSSLSPLYSGPVSQVTSQFILFHAVFFPSYVYIDILLNFSPLLNMISLLLIFLFCSFLYIQRTSNNPNQK